MAPSKFVWLLFVIINQVCCFGKASKSKSTEVAYCHHRQWTGYIMENPVERERNGTMVRISNKRIRQRLSTIPLCPNLTWTAGIPPSNQDSRQAHTRQIAHHCHHHKSSPGYSCNHWNLATGCHLSSSVTMHTLTSICRDICHYLRSSGCSAWSLDTSDPSKGHMCIIMESTTALVPSCNSYSGCKRSILNADQDCKRLSHDSQYSTNIDLNDCPTVISPQLFHRTDQKNYRDATPRSTIARSNGKSKEKKTQQPQESKVHSLHANNFESDGGVHTEHNKQTPTSPKVVSALGALGAAIAVVALVAVAFKVRDAIRDKPDGNNAESLWYDDEGMRSTKQKSSRPSFWFLRSSNGASSEPLYEPNYAEIEDGNSKPNPSSFELSLNNLSSVRPQPKAEAQGFRRYDRLASSEDKPRPDAYEYTEVDDTPEVPCGPPPPIINPPVLQQPHAHLSPPYTPTDAYGTFIQGSEHALYALADQQKSRRPSLVSILSEDATYYEVSSVFSSVSGLEDK